MASEQDWSGKTLGKYRVLRRLGQGGMGVVYLGHDPRLDRQVALKVLPQKLSEDPVQLERFLREARAAARFSHPNVVTIHEIDEQDGICFLAMELMAGSILDLVRSQGRLSWQNATRAIAAVCRALAAAHPAGLVHRDIKPSNILRTATGEVKLSDFGLAKSVGTESSLTTSNAVLGTPTYMSPEQCRSEPLDERSDLYSLGVSYFELLTGRPPYSAEQPIQICFAHCMTPIPDPRTWVESLPDACVSIIHRAMAKEPRDRYPTAAEMLADLRRALADPAAANPQSSPQALLPPSTDTRHLSPPATTRATPMFGDAPEVARPTPPPVSLKSLPSDSPPLVATNSQGESHDTSAADEEVTPPPFTRPTASTSQSADSTESDTPSTLKTPARGRGALDTSRQRLAQLTRRQWFKPAAITAGLAAASLAAWSGRGLFSGSGSTSLETPPTKTTAPHVTQASADGGWIPLFNGKDLKGWSIHPASGDWQVVDGVIVGRGRPGDSYLYHDREDWTDFELLVECRINDRGNSGIFFRCPMNDSLPPGYEAHIDLWNCGRLHRTGLKGPSGIDPPTQIKKSPTEWLAIELRAVGPDIRIRVNGETIVAHKETIEGPTKGYIALQCYEPMTVVEFRRIAWRPVQDLPAKQSP